MVDRGDDNRQLTGTVGSAAVVLPGRKIFMVVPEPVFFPENDRDGDHFRCGNLGIPLEFMGYLASDLHALGADIHVAQPEYRKVFSRHYGNGNRSACSAIPADRFHLTRERVNQYAGAPEENTIHENIRIAASFQRDVLNYLIPRIRPDLIHCCGWMGGLIPAAAAKMGIPCVFTLVNPETVTVPLWFLEEIGIDVTDFWRNLYYQRLPSDLDDTRAANSVDFLLSGIHSSTHLNVVNTDIAVGMFKNANGRKPTRTQRLLRRKYENSSVSIFHENAIKTQDYIDLYELALKRKPT